RSHRHPSRRFPSRQSRSRNRRCRTSREHRVPLRPMASGCRQVNGATHYLQPPPLWGRSPTSEASRRVGGSDSLGTLPPHPPNVVSARRHSPTSPTRGEVEDRLPVTSLFT